MWCVQRRFIGGNGADLEFFTAWNSHMVSVLCSGNSRNQGHCHNKCYIIVLVTQSRLTLCNPMDCSTPGSSVHGMDSPGKNTGVGCHVLLQGIFLTQGRNTGVLHCRQILYHLSHEGILYLNVKKHLCITSITGVANLPSSVQAFLFNCLISRD